MLKKNIIVTVAFKSTPIYFLNSATMEKLGVGEIKIHLIENGGGDKLFRHCKELAYIKQRFFFVILS